MITTALDVLLPEFHKCHLFIVILPSRAMKILVPKHILPAGPGGGSSSVRERFENEMFWKFVSSV